MFAVSAHWIWSGVARRPNRSYRPGNCGCRVLPRPQVILRFMPLGGSGISADTLPLLVRVSRSSGALLVNRGIGCLDLKPNRPVPDTKTCLLLREASVGSENEMPLSKESAREKSVSSRLPWSLSLLFFAKAKLARAGEIRKTA